MQSPGHKEHPAHKVLERHVDGRVTVKVGGQTVADSRDVVEVDEDGNPPRYYFPRGDVKMSMLARTATTSQCPFKGTAHYFAVKTGERTLPDSVWSYEVPFDEHAALKSRLAFWEGKTPEIAIERQA